jgi:EmrB/QacA subfamily drug resistance transporter
MTLSMSQNLPLSQTRRWWVLATVLIGSLVGTFGNSMMNVALPSMLEHYRIGLNVGVWIVTIYVLLFSTLMPVCGRLGDMLGYKRIYLVGMGGVALWTALAANAPSIGWLIAFRALSGIFNAPTLPAVMGIIAEVFPANERGGALGFWATVNGAAHGLGPVISGLLVQRFGWPSIFWFNAALTLIGVAMIAVFVPADDKRVEERFDLLGASTLTLAMILFMFNLTQGLGQEYGPAVNLALWGACFGLLALFLFSQSRLPRPFVDLKLFTQRGYGVVTFVSSAQLFCLFGMQLLLPLFLIGVQGRASGNAGLLVAPLAVTLAAASPGAGRLSDLVGSRLTCLIGMGIVALAGVGLTFWTPETPAGLIVLTLIVLGFGMGLTQSPTANAVTLVVGREKLGVALGIFNMLRFVSGTLGATVFGVILDRNASLGGGMAAFRLDFYLFTAVAAAAALLSFGLPAAPARQGEAVPVES